MYIFHCNINETLSISDLVRNRQFLCEKNWHEIKHSQNKCMNMYRHVEIDNFCAKSTDKKIAKHNQNKGNVKCGVSPRLTIWPCDLDLWPWKSIGFQILLRTMYVPSLVKIHWKMLILECSQGCYGRTEGQMDGRMVALLYPFATSLARG